MKILNMHMGKIGQWFRILYLLGVMLTSTWAYAQNLQVKRHENESKYQLIDGSGRAITNYIFDIAELDTVHNCAKVRFNGRDFLVGADGNIVVPIHEFSSNSYKMLDNFICIEQPGTHLTDVYDYQGHLLMEGVDRLYLSETVKLADGRSINLYAMRHKGGDPMVTVTPDLKTFADYDFESMDAERMTMIENMETSNKTLRNMRGEVLVSEIGIPEYCPLNRAIPYAKAGKQIQALYARWEYEGIELFTNYKYPLLRIYSPDGRLLGEVQQKSILKNNQTLSKAYKKIIMPYLLKRQENERLVHERLEVPMEELMTHNTSPDASNAKSIARAELTSLLPKYSNANLFAVVQPAEIDAKPTKQVDQRLRTSKYGKIKDYKRVVEADGMVYYEQNYANGTTGLANAKGNVIIPPTKDLIVYHSTSQYFSVIDNTYDDANKCYPTHQLYDWDGHLLMDLVKKKYGPKAHFYLRDKGLAYTEVEMGGQTAAFDYFGVQLTPWLSRAFYYSGSDDGFCYSDDYTATGYKLPTTSHRGGKASASKKFATPTAKSAAAKATTKSAATGSTSTAVAANTGAAANAVNEQAMTDMRKSMRDEYWSQYQRATTSQAKMEALMQCMSYCDDKSSMGAVLCNIGVLYANSGQTDMALAYYKQAADCGNAIAQNNMNNIYKAQRKQNRLEKLSAIGNALTQMGNSMAGSMGGNIMNSGGRGNFLQGFVQGMSSGGRGLVNAVTGGGAAGSGPLKPKYANGTKLSDGGTYMFFDAGVGQTESITYDDGSATVTTVQQCYSCVSTGGKCLTCQGSGNGYYMLAAADRYIQCPACGGSGTCGTCHGSRWLQPFTKHYAPGEAEAYMQAVREVKAGSSSGSSSPSKSSSSSSSNKGPICSRCHGSKYETTREQFNNGSGQHPSYHNTAGVSCSICGDSSEHYHSVCARCVGLGREY